MKKLTLLVLLSGLLVTSMSRAELFANPFFALCMDTHDGKHRNLQEQAQLLRELGYDGFGHLWLDDLKERLSTLDAAGLKLFQVYFRVNIAPGAAP
ncbi:MAG: hypothetical protein NTU83_06390, partial [Candidatus Hydrogenedentes bacterium]|nr:hypothetical protein [Candidatus Hydrogenedentota bacterium]